MSAVDESIAYDDQAAGFEFRAGLPERVASGVAAKVRGFASPGALVLEVGAGTGEIGQWLTGGTVRYLGMDRSRPMLEVFRPRLAARPGTNLLQADADRDWPVQDGSASVVFGSRVLHLLRPDHVLRQVRRVAHPLGAVLLCGRVEHDPGSPRALARRRLRALLAERGLRPRETGGRPGRLLALARAAGGALIPGSVAATWLEAVSVVQVIDWWRGKTSIGGINPPAGVAEEVLAALADWAAGTFPRPAAPVTTGTRYLLEGVRISPASQPFEV